MVEGILVILWLGYMPLVAAYDSTQTDKKYDGLPLGINFIILTWITLVAIGMIKFFSLISLSIPFILYFVCTLPCYRETQYNDVGLPLPKKPKWKALRNAAILIGIECTWHAARNGLLF